MNKYTTPQCLPTYLGAGSPLYALIIANVAVMFYVSIGIILARVLLIYLSQSRKCAREHVDCTINYSSVHVEVYYTWNQPGAIT